MHEEAQKLIVGFLEEVSKLIHQGMPHRDAIDLAAVTVGGFIPSIAMQAANKYQEATNPQMPLSQQENVDALAFASMGRLWNNDTYDEGVESTLEDLLAQSIYLILKYGEEEEGIKAILAANNEAPGDKEARETTIKMALT